MTCTTQRLNTAVNELNKAMSENHYNTARGWIDKIISIKLYLDNDVVFSNARRWDKVVDRIHNR